MFISSSLSGDLVGVVVALVAVAIAYCKWKYQYWQKKNVPYLEPSIPFGNIASVIRGKENMGFRVRSMYNEMKAKGWKHGGLYMGLSPSYMILDLDYMKAILTTDFQYFMDRNMYFNEQDDPLSAHLAALRGNRWKNLRAKLTPTFTSGKMKMMFQTLTECEVNLKKHMESMCGKNEGIDIKEILARFGTDVIGSIAFGLDCKSFEDEDSPFRLNSKKNFDSMGSQRLKSMFAMNFPKLAKMLRITMTPKEVTDFFLKVVKDTVEHREKNNYTRNDFMQLLINMKQDKQQGGLTMNEIAAQSFVFFSGGFETSSTLMTFALYELSRNQDIQQKLRNEINEVLDKHGGKITYDSVQDMKYLGQVIDETLRMYPPAPLTGRYCVKDYKVPNLDLTIEKGTTVVIPILGIHYDEEYYPNPTKFDPDRFSDQNKKSRHHYTHLPFGEGPRICIGMRFGLMQARVGLTSLIKNFNFTINRKTKEPLKMKSRSILLTVEGDVWLNAQKV